MMVEANKQNKVDKMTSASSERLSYRGSVLTAGLSLWGAGRFHNQGDYKSRRGADETSERRLR
jgi:hypothetical protein